ncbi:hypothetical protein GLOIN_2v1885182 [Rhizophagus clarus]|uniref:RRM domain-containing protein n=1 Tax=Rhizophagus clarus TaxID=94130 RepID=A0A8H3QC93_9GLOM|nr:hypothetical protein GLOIN_2v1885182 [Rhizophagus clarus]
MIGNKNKKNATPKQQQYSNNNRNNKGKNTSNNNNTNKQDDNEVSVAPTSGLSTRPNFSVPDINVKFNEPYTTNLPLKLSTQINANDQQNTTQMQIDQPVVAPDHQSKNPDIETVVVNNYQMFTSQFNFSPTNKKDKAHEAALHFYQYDRFISVLPVRKKNNDTGKLENVITITFSLKDNFNKTLNAIYKQKIVNTDNSGNETIKYKEFSFAIKHKEPIVLSPEQKEDEKSCTIQVIDIPLFLTKNVIQNAFSILREIEKLNTTPSSQYQQVFITYTNKVVVDHFYYKWSHLIGTYSVRILPCFLSEEKHEKRKAFGLCLSGLPFSTNASDLTEIIKQLNRQTCFIPRHPHIYKLMTCAYIQFSDQKQKDIAKQKLFKYTKGHIKNYTLYLSDPTEKPKICNKCGSLDYIYVSCPDKNKKYNSSWNSIANAWKSKNKEIKNNTRLYA